MALTLKNNYCEICDGFVRKLVEIMVLFNYRHVSSTIWYGRTYGTQYERGWYSEGKRATRSAKELENGDLSKSM